MSNDKLALYLSAEKYRLSKNIPKAIELLKKILAIEPDDLGILKKLTTLYEKENMLQEASAMYLTTATVYQQRHDKAAARDAVDKALKLTPENPAALDLLKTFDAVVPPQEKEGPGKPDAKPDPPVPDVKTPPDDIPPVKLDTHLFKDLTEEQLESIVNVITPLKILKGTCVFEEGELSNSLYIISEGSFEVRTNVTVPGNEKQNTIFSILTPGQFFGEFAFLTNCPRVATVRAREDSLVYQLSKEDLNAIIKQFPVVEDRLFLFYKSRALDLVLTKSALFGGIAVAERRELLELFVLKKYKTGEYIITEGQKDDHLFLIKKGELRVETTNPQGKKVFLSTLSQHQFFGEISFLTGLPRTADVLAITDCEILLISKEDLETIIIKHPNIEKVLKQYHQHRAISTAETLTRKK